jgi:hypothetical protein
LLIVASDHNREEYAHFDPETVPTLFTYFRENSDDLEWIPNEYVKPGWKRVYNGEQYEFTGAGQTLTVEGQTPDLVPAIWTKIHTGEDYPVWVQPTGAHDAYATGVIVHYPTLEDGLWINKINANTTKPDGDIPYNRYWEPYVI